ncbi:MAG: M23 family metallopeptidase [Neisseria sp.]|nr:M23 family metallopeptidase [Neisseria sp.]
MKKVLQYKGRLLSAVLLALAGAAAYAVFRHPPKQEAFKPERVVEELPPQTVNGARTADSYWVEEPVAAGDTLGDILRRYGLDDKDMDAVLDKDTAGQKNQRLRTGQTVSVLKNDNGDIRAIQFFSEDDGERNLIALEKRDGKWQAGASDIEMKTMPTLKSVMVRTSAKGSLAQAGVGVELRESLRDIFSQKFNLDDMQPGDQITLLYNTMYFRGQEMGAGDILAVEVVKDGKIYRAYYYDKGDEGGSYYDKNGKALKTENLNEFVIQPVKYTRISSPYGIRVHPILHTVKMHTGIDFAAPMGTPVYAPADGILTFKGWKGGYGHTVMLQHANGVETLYGHLSAFSPSSGQVKAGEVIGFVGSSGRSTGPHLHYEARIGGQHVNPSTTALPTPKMETVNMAAFRQQQQQAEEKMGLVENLPVTVADLF